MELNAESSLTYRFAEKIANADPLSCEEAQIAAQYGLIDYIAASFAGSRDAGVDKLISMIQEEGGEQMVPLIGRKQKASELQAALVNGFIGHVLDFDDVHSDVRGHPSTVILPALLSAAAKANITGKRFLAAYIIGVEVMARLGQAIGARHYLKGWHNTSTLGVIAAAAAAGYLKGFTASEMAKAMGAAATQASGLRIQFGTETKPLHAGLAAQAAVRSVKFVEYGIGTCSSVMDGEIGFLKVYGEGGSFAEAFLLRDWGVSWKIVEPGLWFKIYPFCSAAHHAADAAVELAAKYEIKPENIKEIAIIFPPMGDAALIERRPKTGEQGRFSAEYVVALALKGYPLTLDNLRNTVIPMDVQSLIERASRFYDANIRPAANSVPTGRFTIIKVVCNDGQSFQARVDCPRGAPGNRLTISELAQKLKQSVACDQLAEKILKGINQLALAKDLKALSGLLF